MQLKYPNNIYKAKIYDSKPERKGISLTRPSLWLKRQEEHMTNY